MQPYFFPYLGYFQLIQAVDKFILYDNVNYIKKGWVNRNRLVVQGRPRFIVVPLQQQSSAQKIRDARIDMTRDWRKRLFGTIYLNYKRCAFFDEVFPLIERVLAMDVEHLTELNCSSVRWIAEFLEIPTDIVTDVSNYEGLERDLSEETSRIREEYTQRQNLSDTKTIRIFLICRNEGAGTYINAIGGQALYDKSLFANNGIALWFVKTLPYSYEQRADEFFSSMSIIDVLMNCGKAGTKELLSRYELI